MKAQRRPGDDSVAPIKNAVTSSKKSSGGVKAIKNSVGVQSAKQVKVRGAVS